MSCWHLGHLSTTDLLRCQEPLYSAKIVPFHFLHNLERFFKKLSNKGLHFNYWEIRSAVWILQTWGFSNWTTDLGSLYLKCRPGVSLFGLKLLIILKFLLMASLTIHTVSFTSGALYCISTCCSVLAADFGARWLLPDQNCERRPGRRLQTERGVHPQDQGGLQAGPNLFGRLCLYEGQPRVLLHWQTRTQRCLWGFKFF